MEERKIVLCDTDVFVEFYRNNQKIISELRKIGEQNIAISIITGGELMFGARNKKELTNIKKDIDNLILIDLDINICNIFRKLTEQYVLSHRLTLPDGLIAATAIVNKIELFTLNKKDFRFIDGLALYSFP